MSRTRTAAPLDGRRRVRAGRREPLPQHRVLRPDRAADVPRPAGLVAVSGVAEVLGGVGLLVPRSAGRPGGGWSPCSWPCSRPTGTWPCRRPAGHAGRPRWVRWARLPLQAVLIAWVEWASRPDPPRPRAAGSAGLPPGPVSRRPSPPARAAGGGPTARRPRRLRLVRRPHPRQPGHPPVRPVDDLEQRHAPLDLRRTPAPVGPGRVRRPHGRQRRPADQSQQVQRRPARLAGRGRGTQGRVEQVRRRVLVRQAGQLPPVLDVDVGPAGRGLAPGTAGRSRAGRRSGPCTAGPPARSSAAGRPGARRSPAARAGTAPAGRRRTPYRCPPPSPPSPARTPPSPGRSLQKYPPCAACRVLRSAASVTGGERSTTRPKSLTASPWRLAWFEGCPGTESAAPPAAAGPPASPGCARRSPRARRSAACRPPGRARRPRPRR